MAYTRDEIEEVAYQRFMLFYAHENEISLPDIFNSIIGYLQGQYIPRPATEEYRERLFENWFNLSFDELICFSKKNFLRYIYPNRKYMKSLLSHDEYLAYEQYNASTTP